MLAEHKNKLLLLGSRRAAKFPKSFHSSYMYKGVETKSRREMASGELIPHFHRREDAVGRPVLSPGGKAFVQPLCACVSSRWSEF